MSPACSHDLVGQRQILRRLGDGTNASRRLEAHRLAALLDGFEHYPRRFRRGIDRHLAGRGLDKIGTSGNGQLGGTADQQVPLQLATFDDHLERHLGAADLAALLHHAEPQPLIALPQRLVGEDQIHLIGSGGHGLTGLGHRQRNICLTGRKVGDGSHLDPGT